jgi:hypothetical protein
MLEIIVSVFSANNIIFRIFLLSFMIQLQLSPSRYLGENIFYKEINR